MGVRFCQIVRCFLCINQMIIFFLLHPVNVGYIILIDFLGVEPPLHFWHKSHLDMMYNLYMLLYSACQYFVEEICIYVHKVYLSSVFFFFFDVLSGFGIGVMLALWNKLGSVPSVLFFWKNLRIDVNSFVNVWLLLLHSIYPG